MFETTSLYNIDWRFKTSAGTQEALKSVGYSTLKRLLCTVFFALFFSSPVFTGRVHSRANASAVPRRAFNQIK